MDAPTHEDLSRLRAIAEEGRAVPLLGGWHLILWGAAMTLALLVHWAVLRDILPWPDYTLSFSWFGIAGAAWLGSVLIGRAQAGEPGACSVGNQVERVAWMTVGAFLSLLAIALFARASLSADRAAWGLFAMLPPVTFGAYAVALHVSAVAAAASSAARPFVFLALAFAAATAFLIGDAAQYLAAAAGMALVTVPPGLAQLAAARRPD